MPDPVAFERNKSLNIYQRLHAVMQEVDYVQKTHSIDVGKGYKVVTHDAVTAKVRPSLVKHGVVYFPANLRVTQSGNRTETLIDVQFVNVDTPSEFILVPSVGYGIDTGDKGPGKAMSYAVKYALLKALGLETGEDADLDPNAEDDEDNKPTPAKVNGNGAKPPPERPMTKQQARPEYTTLLKELQAQPTLADLEAWGARNKVIRDALPPDWQAQLKNEYSEHKQFLKQGRAA